MRSKIEIIRDCIETVRKSGKKVTVDSVITVSLFQPFGTLDANDTELIEDEFWAIRERIERRVNKAYPQDGFVSGLAAGIEVNAFFNYTA